MNRAERMLDDARASNRGRPIGTATAKTSHGEVIVAWNRPEQHYEVGTAARMLSRFAKARM